MHPQLLHQIADDRVIERRRSHLAPPRGPRRRLGARPTARVRTRVGGLLIAVGTRVAGPRSEPLGLPSHPSV